MFRLFETKKEVQDVVHLDLLFALLFLLSVSLFLKQDPVNLAHGRQGNKKYQNERLPLILTFIENACS